MISDTVATALVSGLVIGIPATFTGLASLIVALRQSRKVEGVEKKADTIIEKAVEIHTLTNSNLNKVTSSLEVANQKIEGLNKLVMSMVEAKRVADMTAGKQTDASMLDRNGRLEELKHKIDENTEVTLRIEEKTAAVVDDLAAAHKRADEHKDDEPGAAADASAKQTKKKNKEES